MSCALTGPNIGVSIQTPNVFVENTGIVMGISASVLPAVENVCENVKRMHLRLSVATYNACGDLINASVLSGCSICSEKKSNNCSLAFP